MVGMGVKTGIGWDVEVKEIETGTFLKTTKQEIANGREYKDKRSLKILR